MQTFLPDGAFSQCARVLDNRRLGKQRVECLQILKALRGETKGWRNHPATLMWHGHESCLGVYLNCMIEEWERRGFRNSIPRCKQPELGPDYFPEWMLDFERFDRVLNSHRSNLLRKDYAYYSQFGWIVEADLPYYWPVTKEDVALKRILEVCP